MSLRKPAFCMCENKDEDQLRGNCTTDQHLCFCYKVQSLYFLNSKFHRLEISDLGSRGIVLCM